MNFSHEEAKENVPVSACGMSLSVIPTIKFATAIGKVSDVIPCSVEGDKIRIGVNNRYLIDALANSETDEVAIEMNDPLRPIKIKPAQGDDFLFIVMPMKMEEKW